MSEQSSRMLSLEVPIIVLLAEKTMTVQQVVRLSPGSIIELPKASEEKLELMVNNKVIGRGDAVKVGENFGLEITEMGAIAKLPDESAVEEEVVLGNDDIEALTASLLAG